MTTASKTTVDRDSSCTGPIRCSGIFSDWCTDPVGEILGTGFCRFVSPTGVEGLAKSEGDRLDVLAVFCRTPGRGCFREFMRRARARFVTVCVWEDWNPVVGDALVRWGFRRVQQVEPDGEIITGWRWDRSPNGAGETAAPTGAGSTLPAGSAAQAANQTEAHPHHSDDAQRRPNT